MISSDVLKNSLKKTILLMDKDKSMIILSLLLLRTRVRENEILAQCIEIIEDFDLCEELLKYVDKNKKYFEIIDNTIVLKEELTIYANILYDILQDLDNFVVKVSEHQLTVNDIVSRSLTPSALILVISSNPENTSSIDLIVYYFTTILLAELFLSLSKAYPYFRKLISSIEAMFST